MKFKRSLSIALILTSFVLVWNAYESPNFFVSDEQSNKFSMNLSQQKLDQESLMALSNYRQSFSSKVSNTRLLNILDTSLPKNSCIQAYAQSGQKFRVDPMIDLRGDVALVPASTYKYVTAALVLSVFEKNDTLDTEMFADEKKEQIDRAYLKTSGDPTFVSVKTLSPRRPANLSPRNTRTFMEFAIDISKSGVKNIGELVVDSSWFALPQVESGWEKDKLQVGQISALNIDEGFEGEELSENPNLYASRVLVNFLSQQGVNVGKIVEGEIPSEIETKEKRIGSTSSPTIETLVSDMLKTSDNVYAEQLLAVAVGTVKGNVDVQSRRIFVEEQFKSLNIKLDGFVFENGSGYSTKTRLTCAQVNQINQRMKEKGIDLTELASTSGVDGTLEMRFGNIQNRLQAKTGTLDNVTALSGKLDERFLFSFIANSQFDVEQGYRFQEVVVDALDSYPYVQQPDL